MKDYLKRLFQRIKNDATVKADAPPPKEGLGDLWLFRHKDGARSFIIPNRIRFTLSKEAAERLCEEVRRHDPENTSVYFRFENRECLKCARPFNCDWQQFEGGPLGGC